MQIGGGAHRVHGSLNIDLVTPAEFVWDIPLQDDSTEEIFSEHFLEHSDYPRPAKHSELSLAATPTPSPGPDVHTVGILQRWRFPDKGIEVARLLVSELAANAIQHSRPTKTPEAVVGVPIEPMSVWTHSPPSRGRRCQRTPQGPPTPPRRRGSSRRHPADRALPW